jgi:hypothetical protein
LAWAFVFGPGCHSLSLTSIPNEKPKEDTQVSAPSKCTFRLSQYVFYSDFEVNRGLPIFSELASLRDQVYRDLQLPNADTIIYVHLFETKDRYERFMKSRYPELPRRRAFFVAQPRVRGTEELLVYTYWGDRIQEDLRHELTHALLHSVLSDVPLWLDEGLAEYFEVPPGWKGINYQHLDHLRRTGGASSFRPDLARLEQLSQVDQMKPAEYRESWAWVHFMLHSSSRTKKILVTYLQELRKNKNPALVRPRLKAIAPDLEDALERHVATMDGLQRPMTASRK